ncbi:hypothetical protein JX266_006055 [Neoarthrinium moseri]|nr:hypothetical protein JX266_006055 [Neoarthrinium moseri]
MKPVLIQSRASFFGRRFLNSVFYYVQVLIRFSRLQVLGQWLHPREKPKVALYHDRGVALIQSMAHLVPLSVVMAFIVLNIKSWYWGDPSATVLTALQFAAKILEILMQASLGIIMMSIVRYQLFKDGGLPLGSLLGPYSVTDVTYLWSLELWGSLLSKHARLWQRLFIALAIAAMLILASLVGPSIAVLLIPRPIDYTTGHFLQMLDDQATIFPGHVQLQGVNLTNEDAFRDVLYQIVRNKNDDLQFTDATNLIRTIPSYDNTPLFFPNPSPMSGVGTLAATLVSQAMRFPGMTFFSGGQLTNAEMGEFARATTFQPYVQSDCKRQWLNSTDDPKSVYVTFGDISPEATNLTFADLVDIIKSVTADNATTNTIAVAWNDAPTAASNHSILMVKGLLLEGGETNHEDATVRSESCIIDAVWAKTNMNGTLSLSSDELINAEMLPADSQQFDSQLIRIPSEWASRVVDVYVEYQPDITSMPLERIFALALANTAPVPRIEYGPIGWHAVHNDPMYKDQEADTLSMSQAQYDATKAYFQANKNILSKHNDVFFYTSTNWSDPGNLYQLEVESFRQGYGYSSSGVPVLLSLIVVSIYALVAVVHLLYTFATGHVGRSWDTLAELLMLGLHSQPPGVAATTNTTVGIETAVPFEEPVSVRVNENGRAELVFLRDDLNKRRALGRIKANEAY